MSRRTRVRFAPSPTGFHQRYGFNGKEFENGLDWRVNDFGARMYDPVLGRWGSVDPKAHLAPSW